MSPNIVPPKGGSLLAYGATSWVYRIGQSNTVMKIPKFIEGEDHHNQYCEECVAAEREVYNVLGSHKAIISHKGYDDDHHANILEYADGGDFCDFVRVVLPSAEDRFGMIKQLVEGVKYIHARHILVNDWKHENLLFKEGELKLSDFTEATMYEDGIPVEAVYKELWAVGCLIYSIETWTVSSHDFSDELSAEGRLPSTDGLWFSQIIDKCWERGYPTAEDLVQDVYALLRSGP